MNSILVSWKTTIVGWLLAGLLVLQQHLKDGISFSDPQLWIAVAIAVFAAVARDGNKSDQDQHLRP